VRGFRLTWRRGLLASLLVLGGTAAALWLIPSDHYLLLPDTARPVEPLVSVPDEKAGSGEDGGIYMVDILVRKANLLERLFPSLEDGASLIPAQVLNPEGVSDKQRQRSSNLDMSRSQKIAAAVALEALGYKVDATPSGAEISLVVPDSPAAAAGLQPGDVIVAARGRQVRFLSELSRAMDGVEPGEKITIKVRRNGGLTDYTLTTIPSDRDPARAVIGVVVQQAATIDLPVKVSIDAGSIGGPSAGLAFALDIVDELGTDVDRGRRIVVTGELGLDGQVDPIGGVKQKTIGAKEAGADIFVVPEGNAAEARKYADGLRIIPVETFGDALEALGAVPVTS
jgi:PDZ domain-containing protein